MDLLGANTVQSVALSTTKMVFLTSLSPGSREVTGRTMHACAFGLGRCRTRSAASPPVDGAPASAPRILLALGAPFRI